MGELRELHTWQDYINAARAKGYAVESCGDDGFFIITPAKPRQPSQQLGSYKTERAAWRGAAHMAHLEGN